MKPTPVAAFLLLVGCQDPTPGLDLRPPEPPTRVVTAAAAVARSAPPITAMTLIAAEPPPADQAAPPWTLTASDGSGLQLTRVDARAVVEGPLAFTELHLYFHNPESRTREGTFAITLPPGAAVSRFAMEIDGRWQEAEVVEKMAARRAYDDFLHRRQDPALLEKAAGNQFSARVFPIPAKADKHLVLSFSQELVGRGYVLPLRGLPVTKQVDVTFAATRLDGSRAEETLTQHDWQPDRDFVAAAPASAAAVTSGVLVAGAIAVANDDQLLAPAEPPTQVTLLVDTSASRALGFGGYVRSIRGLIDALRGKYGDGVAVQVIAFDQDSQPIYDGPAAGYGEAQDRALIARGAAGASDLAQVVATLAASPTAIHRRLVVVTDGVLTAGPETLALVAAIKALPIDRLDVVLAGGIRDERLASSIVRAGLPRAGDVHDLDRGLAAVATGLGEPVLVDVAVEIPGATWVYPSKIPAARPGSPLMVYARLAKPAASIDVIIGGRRRTIGLGGSTPALIERAVAGAEIEELENRLATTPPADARALRADIARRSVSARVISSQTSMLVLETEADYARYQIERTALADILAVGPDGIEQTRRATIIAQKAPPPPPPKPVPTQTDHGDPAALADRAQVIEQARTAGVLGSSDIASGFDDQDVQGQLLDRDRDGAPVGAFGYGRSGMGPGGGGTGWGTIGTGRYGAVGRGAGTGSGYGVGSGRGGMRGRSASVPSVRIGQATVEGNLDRAIIRRYIRRNIARITYCYERQLLAHPGLAGVVSARFFIMPSGVVGGSSASGVDAEVAACVDGVIKTIAFPAPADGAGVQVEYPFTFSPTGGTTTLDDRGGDGGGGGGGDSTDDEEHRGGPPLTGKLAEVMKALRRGGTDQALAIAKAWHDEAPGDVLALIALGEVLEARKDVPAAARVYGSIIDLFSTRADLRRFAGERLERLGAPARHLAIDTYRKAVADRPDHVSAHRLLAYALVRSDDHAGAFAAILAGIDQAYPDGRFPGADRVLGEDAGMIAAVYLAHGGPRDEITQALRKRSLTLASQPSTRFVMYWETDANDVDFHIRDSRGGHAWYSDMRLPSGGELYADVTTGYGPECFAIQGTPKAGPYQLSINYFSQGPMGYGMGLLQIQRFDGKNLRFDDRPYVIMTDHAFVDLGTFR